MSNKADSPVRVSRGLMAAKVSLVVLTLAWPFLVFFTADRIDPKHLVILVVALYIVRQLFTATDRQSLWLAGAVFLYGLWALLGDHPRAALYYPVFMNIAMFVFFAVSLRAPQTVIERLARMRNQEVSEHAPPYLRKLTKIWCALFAFNGVMAFVTATWMSEKSWLLFNGMIAYLLIGALIVGELLYRPVYKRRMQERGGSNV